MYEKLKYSFGTLFLRLLLEMQGTAIFSGQPSHPHPKACPFTGQRQLHICIVLRPEYWPGPGNRTRDLSALLSIALLTELIRGRIRKLINLR